MFKKKKKKKKKNGTQLLIVICIYPLEKVADQIVVTVEVFLSLMLCWN